MTGRGGACPAGFGRPQDRNGWSPPSPLCQGSQKQEPAGPSCGCNCPRATRRQIRGQGLTRCFQPPVTDPLPGFQLPPEEKGERFRSPKSDHRENFRSKFDLGVSGWKELYLTLGDGGNGTGSDHGAWFDPILVKKDGSTIKLTDLKWSKATQGWGKTRIGFSRPDRLARKDGQPMTAGIGTHSIGSISYKKLPAEVVRFKCTAGLANWITVGKFAFT